ncbi:purple acid phosphatase 2-like [Pyrus ussuriensis x Pyrus communis]|uniref:Purple acid phosphatase 2-like n=1 Tax=Pyrus ussuriensis x Pyrus communis TaxID=2448454 RepID=A0A5N5HRN1_9ROSA|nr:purple acid phosphatase 2-like [Pyrus ussuriensis x Pyrus communis]
MTVQYIRPISKHADHDPLLSKGDIVEEQILKQFGRVIIFSWHFNKKRRFWGRVTTYRDLGQTHDSNRILSHYELNPMKGQTTAGNHEIDFVLSLYGERKYTPRYKWLEKELPKVNKTVTPWLIVLMHSHSPLYNSYVHHYMEGESFRVMYQEYVPYTCLRTICLNYIGFRNECFHHRNGYQMLPTTFRRLCTPISDQSAPVYITIGGNLEGLVTEMSEPQLSYSAFREVSFGHRIFNIKNRTHGFFSWHRNQDGYAVEADSLWLKDRYWNRLEESSSLAVFSLPSRPCRLSAQVFTHLPYHCKFKCSRDGRMRKVSCNHCIALYSSS